MAVRGGVKICAASSMGILHPQAASRVFHDQQTDAFQTFPMRLEGIVHVS